MPWMWVEFDRDVFEAVERRRRRHRESPNDLLRRLMRLDEALGPDEPGLDRSGPPWMGQGVTLPHGTELRMTHAGRTWFGAIGQGEWLVGRERFTGPEEAARWIAGRCDRRGAKPDAWSAWNVRLPSRRDWRVLVSLRNR